MKKPVTYCKSWFRAKKRPTEVWSTEQARAAHEAHTLYTALVGPADKPTSFLEVTKGFVGVGFLDEHLREQLTYGFREVEPGLLFLSMATYRDFQDDTDKVSEGTTYVFSREGQVKMERQRFMPHKTEVAEGAADVSKNYSRWPRFGEYDDLIRVERG